MIITNDRFFIFASILTFLATIWVFVYKEPYISKSQRKKEKEITILKVLITLKGFITNKTLRAFCLFLLLAIGFGPIETIKSY